MYYECARSNTHPSRRSESLKRPSTPRLNLCHDLLTERHLADPTYVRLNMLAREISEGLYSFDNYSFTD